jgi:hypothetical protein
MPKPRSGESNRDRPSDRGDRERHSGEYGRHEFENDEGNRAHIEIEERRFRGGVPPTPELYERAREQWNRLPGAVGRRVAMNQTKSEPAVDAEARPAAAEVDEDKKEGSQ